MENEGEGGNEYTSKSGLRTIQEEKGSVRRFESPIYPI